MVDMRETTQPEAFERVKTEYGQTELDMRGKTDRERGRGEKVSVRKEEKRRGQKRTTKKRVYGSQESLQPKWMSYIGS